MFIKTTEMESAAVTGRMPVLRAPTTRAEYVPAFTPAPCAREGTTAGGREANQSHAFDSPCRARAGARTARPSKKSAGVRWVDRMLMKATELERSRWQAERLSRDPRRCALGTLLAARMRQRPEAGRRVEVTPLTRRGRANTRTCEQPDLSENMPPAPPGVRGGLVGSIAWDGWKPANCSHQGPRLVCRLAAVHGIHGPLNEMMFAWR